MSGDVLDGIVLDRFWSKVDRRIYGCWQWTDGLTRAGYGRLWTGDKLVYAHRFSYELLVGPIPEGLQIDHLCRNRWCVNPEHLEPVTQLENGLRGIHGVLTTQCAQGHLFDDLNTHWRVRKENGRPRRDCLTCRRSAQRRYRAKVANGR